MQITYVYNIRDVTPPKDLDAEMGTSCVRQVKINLFTTAERNPWHYDTVLFGVCGGLIQVSGYLRFFIWGLLLCGEVSLFLSDVARLGVLDLSGSVG